MIAKQPSRYAIAWTASIGMFMGVLDSTIVNVALTPMANALGADLGGIQWVITGYFLTQAAIIPLAGYFGGRFGIKRLFILCQLIFTLGSVLCGFSQSLDMLILFRVLQGIGGGGLFPLAQAIALRSFPPQERANASAIIGVSALVAPALGPTLGGILTDSFGWQAIFFVNLPIGLIAAFLAWRIVPKDELVPAQNQSRFDIIGLSLSILGVLAIVYGFSLVSETRPGSITPLQPRGEVYGWSYGPVWALLGAGLVILAAFAFYELRISRDPVLDLRLFKNYNFTLPMLACCVIAMAIFGSFFLVPVFLELVRTPHLSPTEAGLLLLPQGVASAVAVLLSGRLLYNRLGVRVLVSMGAVLLIVGTVGLVNLQPNVDTLSLLPWLIVRGFGFGFTFVPTQTRALQDVTGLALAKGSSLLNVLRQIASSVGTAIASTTFLQQTARHATELRSQLPANTPVNPGAAQALAAQAGTQAINDVFGLVLAGSVLILLLALALPGRYRQPTSLQQGSEAPVPVALD